MMSYKTRLEKHQKQKQSLKWTFYGMYFEHLDETWLCVSITGNEHAVMQAASKYYIDTQDRLTLQMSDDFFVYKQFGEERAGMIGRPHYKIATSLQYFSVNDEDEREEFYELVGDDDNSAIREMFGGSK